MFWEASLLRVVLKGEFWVWGRELVPQLEREWEDYFECTQFSNVRIRLHSLQVSVTKFCTTKASISLKTSLSDFDSNEFY